MAETHRPWPLAAGIATAAAGVTLIIFAVVGNNLVSARLAAAAVVLAALVELATGALLTRRGGAGMAHVVSGLLAVGLALYVIAQGLILPQALGAAPIALALGLFCLLNGIFRGIDVIVDRPQAALGEAIDCAFSFVLGAVLLSHWRDASPSFITVIAGIELISGGLSLFASVFAHDHHLEEPGYDGRPDRMLRASAPPISRGGARMTAPNQDRA